MDESTIITQLQTEGFSDVQVVPLPPDEDSPEHTHDEHSVHIILEGELTIIDADGTHTYKEGDRVEFPAGTTHKARGTKEGTMVIGFRR